MPEVASDGTDHDADTDQLPQSRRPVSVSCEARGLIRLRDRPVRDRGDEPRAVALVVAQAIDVDPVGGDVVLFTLNETVSPWSTLMSVAKPCSAGSPAPVMSHSLEGLPGRQFSASIVLAGLGQLA